MTVTLNDAGGAQLASVSVGEIGMGRNPAGHDVIRVFNGQAQAPVSIASRWSSVNVSVQHTGHVTPLWESRPGT